MTETVLKEFSNHSIWCLCCKKWIEHPIKIQLEFNSAKPKSHEHIYSSELKEITSYCSQCYAIKQQIIQYEENIERLKEINNLNRRERPLQYRNDKEI